MSIPTIALRPAEPADTPFLARVYASTREGELARVPWSEAEKASFLDQQFAAQSAHYARHYADASFDVVLVDGEPAGRLIVHRGEACVRVVDIALLGPARGRGVGSRLLRDVLDEADARGLPVSIHVEHENPAQSLYARLGFAPVQDAGVYLLLERPAGARGPMVIR